MDSGKIWGKRLATGSYPITWDLCISISSDQIDVLDSNLISAYLHIETEIGGKGKETLRKEEVPNIGSNNQNEETIFK